LLANVRVVPIVVSPFVLCTDPEARNPLPDPGIGSSSGRKLSIQRCSSFDVVVFLWIIAKIRFTSSNTDSFVDGCSTATGGIEAIVA
jgi:hypothetical protein